MKEIIFREVYSSTPKQIKMSTPVATYEGPFEEKKIDRRPWLTQEIETEPLC